MNAVSMSTRSLRDILNKAEEKGLGFKVCMGRDVAGPGGAVFIKAHTELTERHLTWLEQRNPFRDRVATYVEVVFLEGSAPGSLPDEIGRQAQPAEKARQRRKRAERGSREVTERAEAVSHQAQEVFRLIGDLAFPESALRHPKVQANLQELDERIRHFHAAVRSALDEYLAGNTLIMDLISQYGLGSRVLQHGLNAAVLATEIASQVLVADREKEAGAESAAPAEDRSVEQGDAEEASMEMEEQPVEPQEGLKRELAEIFLGGFMHDCGLWSGELNPEEGHEAAGARLIHSIPSIGDLAPALIRIVLFHSEISRLANKAGVVEIIEEREEGKVSFDAEFYSTAEDAQAALRLRPGRFRAEVVSQRDLGAILPVAMAEHYLTRREGFDAQSPGSIVGRLAGDVRGGLYERFIVAMSNVQGVAPRRAYAILEGTISVLVEEEDGSRRRQSLNLTGCEGCSIGHGDDLYSPHLILLFGVDADGRREKLEYVDPRDGFLWGHALRPKKRMYIAAGRHREELTVRVTGFMNGEVYGNVLGEYEQELKRQMQS
jgi:hypothetical protein